MKRFAVILSLVCASMTLGGCSEHAEQTAQRSVSPLIGTWERDGGVPKPNATALEFTKLTFAADGSLKATYVAAGGALAGVLDSAPKVKIENDTYRTPDSTTLKIAEGTSGRTYDFRVSDGKLYLTPHGAGDASVFSKASDRS